jgi:predicted NUDIX family phosphoesterase
MGLIAPHQMASSHMKAHLPVSPAPSLILTIPRHQAPALPDAGCWPVADLAFMHPPLWRERALVEHDETLLQPVAYGVLFNGAGEVWCYRRAGGDARVDGRLSCGVGGHVDAQDATTINAPDTFDPEATLRRAWLRELAEELQADALHLADVRLHGLVYEGQSAIGRVHLGVVFSARWVAPVPPQPPAHEALCGLGFMPLAAIVADDRFELWSRLVASHLLSQVSVHNPVCA